jgi:hypothetical protein
MLAAGWQAPDRHSGREAGVHSQLTYEDFDLLIEPGSQSDYRARVLRSPAGESGPVPFSLPFSPLELKVFVLEVGRPRRGGTRGPGRPEIAPIKEFGGQLYSAVFHDELRDTLMRSLTETGAQRAGLRLRLRLVDTPELAGLPWEFLYDPRRNRFLALSHRTPLVRYLDLPDPPRPLSVEGPLRLLVMISSPSDYPILDVEQEWRILTEALAPLQATGRVAVERLETASLAALQPRLRREEFHIFHFIGHGGYRPDWGDGVLVMEDRTGRGREIAGEELGGLLNDHDPMRLAVLNACEGARSDATDPFAGVAQSLIQQGLPAVVAMQFEITDDAAIIFAQELYGAVADGYPLDATMAEARRAIRNDGNSTEWGTPVLYSRAPDGRLFDLTARPPAISAPPAATPAPPTVRTKSQENERDTDTDRQQVEAAVPIASWRVQPPPLPVIDRPSVNWSIARVGMLEDSSEWELLSTKPVYAVAYSPDGRLLANGSSDKTVQLWDVASGNLQHILDTGDWVYAVAFSPNGRLLASGSLNGTVQLWEVTSGNLQHTLQHDSPVRAVTFSPDGRLLASASSDKTVRLWEVTSGNLQHTLHHDSEVRVVRFSPDGWLLASASSDKTVRLWEVTSGNLQDTVHHENWVEAVAFSGDGRLLAAGTGGQRAVLYTVRSPS